MAKLLRSSPTIAFRVDAGEAGLLARLDERGEKRGVVARRDLGRYYDMLADALQRVAFTAQEAQLLADIPVEEMSDHRLLWATVANAIRDEGLDVEALVHDPAELVRRLRELTASESCAVVDALERFQRARSANGSHADLLLLGRVGLIRDPPAGRIRV
jgi:hypothetical protein